MKIRILACIRTGKPFKYFSAFIALSIFFQCVSPTVALALTSGPAQEEFASFEPATTTDMVDIYSGDFNYNIPLLSVPGPNGGYPLNLSYHSGIGMEQEASWVGLGWSLNVGAINRQLRGLPDDFKGDAITQKMHLKKNVTVGIDLTKSRQREVFGFPKPTREDNPNALKWQIYYNTYKGLGYRVFTNIARENQSSAASVNVGISYDSQEGLGIEPNMSLAAQYGNSGLSFNLGASYNSRQGVTNLSFSSSVSGRSASEKSAVCEDDGQPYTHNVSGMGYGSSSILSYGTSQSVPTVTIPMRTETYPFDTRYGQARPFGTFTSRFPLAWKGFVSVSDLENDGNVSSDAYGYLYTANAKSSDMKDFQRNNIEYSKKIPNLPISTFTYDLFTQTGQGTGCMFRPFYSSVGTLSTPKRKNIEVQRRLNMEFGITLLAAGAIVHGGLGYTNVDGSLSSGSWEEGNEVGNELQFDDDNGELNYESYYFQKYGEKSGVLLSDDQIATKWGGDNAVRVKLTKTLDFLDRQFVASKDFIEKESGTTVFTAGRDQQYRKQRQARASNIEVLTDAQAAAYGGKQAQFGYSDLPGQSHVPNKTFDHGASKISEISMLQPDGMRYTYGLPAYNKKQMEAVFSVNGSTQTTQNNNNIAVPYSGNDIVPYDGNITDQYLSETNVPEYAHSWLLTSVVSSDYVDLTDNGPTDDDYGYWVKFNYEKTAEDYRWRIPYTGANYMQGSIGEYSDDKGSFTYGEKEIYFLKSVETKTHIATFTPGDREDGLEAYGLPSSTSRTRYKMKKLEKISLYTKAEYGSQTPSNPAVPIKEAHFKYNYNLCKGIKNSTSFDNVGKLTLEQVYFTYQNSNRGELSPYRFSYGESEDNPNYNDKNMDRWGNYKKNLNASGQPYTHYPFLEFPYTQQEEAPNVDVWTLHQIDLPTGGTIKVNYESDDYAYVESKRATHMFDIVSIGISPNPNQIPNRDRDVPWEVRTETHVGGDGKNYRVYFKLDMPDAKLALLNQTERDNYVHDHLNGIKKVYFKTFANLEGTKHDFVTGYADLATTGTELFGCELVPGSGPGNPPPHYYGFITLKSVDLKKYSIVGQQVNPFTKAAIQHLRISRPELIYKASGSNSTDPMSQIQNLFGSIKGAGQDIMSAIMGFNTWAFSKGYGQAIAVDGRSIIRLCDPDGKKYGGGIRVKSISISDNWDVNNQNITNNSTGAAVYGQKYEYTLEENGRTISSGVAYEPTIGGEESALRIPAEYEESTFLGTTSNLYLDKPIMESYYPGATVGYRKVIVRSIAPDQADLSDNNALDGTYKIERTTAPLTIYDFYSPKDFPIGYDETDMNADPAIIRPLIIPGIYSGFKKRKARSQGYSLILNDMAGKLKSVTYRTNPTDSNPEGGFISKEEYIYNTESAYDPGGVNRLSNKVQVLSVNPTNSAQTIFQTGVLGQTHDVFVDMNENVQRSEGLGGDFNLELEFHPPSAAIFFPIPIPYASRNEASMKTVVTIKVIYRTAILKKVITTSRESVVTRESLAFDIENGKPLLTKVTNEFEDPIYEHTYPAHWYYKNMAGAYKNYGFYKGVNATATSTGGVNPGITVSDYFNVGDELFVNNTFKAHIYEVDALNNLIKLIKRDGGYVTGAVTSLKVITSGRKNLLDAEAGKILSKQITGFNENLGDNGVYTFSQIVDASAVEFSDQWDPICDRCGAAGNTLPKDPFITGESGAWRPYKSYVYKTDRSYNYGSEKSRTDGTYADFAYFPWYNPAIRSAKWIAANTITKYSPYGFELENKDAIGNYSSALYGYNQSLSVAIAKNAQYKEIAFDGFEDYDFSDCKDHRLPFESDKTKITQTEKHTGRSSIRLFPGEKVELETSLKDCRP